MKRTLVILFAVLAIVSAVQTDQGLSTILAQVQDDSFGQALGAMVQMHMESEAGPKGRLQEIADLLAEFRATLDEQRQNAKSAIETKRAFCTAQVKLLTEQLDTISKNLDDSNKESSDLVDEQKQKKKDLDASRSNFADTRTDQANAQADLDNENKVYAEHKASFEEAIIACQEAIRLLKDMVKSQSGAASAATTAPTSATLLVQLGQKFESIKNLLEEHVKKSPNAFIQPIIDVLMELGTDASRIDYKKVSQIIDLIQTLLARLRDGLHDRDISHLRTVDDLNALIGHLKEAIASSTKNIGILTERLKEIQRRIDELAKLTDNLAAVQSSFKTSLVSVNADCKDAENQYQTSEDARKRNIATLDKLITYFNSEVTTSVNKVESF